MSGRKLLVTGAAGQLGKRVVELLLESGETQIVATTRTPEKLAALVARGVEVRKADFDDEGSLSRAFAGAERILLISTDALDESGKRIAQHARAIRAAESAGAKHVVYTSMPNPYSSPVPISPDHAQTEDALAASKLDYTVLRNSLYADLLLQIIPSAVASGQLIDARGEGSIAWVTREDCARAAAAALRSSEGGRRRLEVTGPEPISSPALAALVGELVGKQITHLSVPAADLVRGLVGHGIPPKIAEVFAGFDVATARGDYANVSDTVTRLTGKAPTSVVSFLQANRALFT